MMDSVFASLLIAAVGFGVVTLSRSRAKRWETRLFAAQPVVATVVGKDTVVVGENVANVLFTDLAPEGVEVSSKVYESIEPESHIELWNDPSSGQLVHPSGEHNPVAFHILVIGWIIVGVGLFLAAVNLIESLLG